MSDRKDSSKIPASPAQAPSATRAVNPAALSIAQLAGMLGVSEGKVREHLDAGAPSDAKGMINLVHYAAWLNRQLVRTDGD